MVASTGQIRLQALMFFKGFSRAGLCLLCHSVSRFSAAFVFVHARVCQVFELVALCGFKHPHRAAACATELITFGAYVLYRFVQQLFNAGHITLVAGRGKLITTQAMQRGG